MPNRTQPAQIANETTEMLDRESYVVGGATLSLSDALNDVQAGTVLYKPADVTMVEDGASASELITVALLAPCSPAVRQDFVTKQ